MTANTTPLKNDLLLKALSHQKVPRLPVWLMRQAGRVDPEYRAYRERVGLSLYDLFRAPEHAVPISLLPKRLGVDAIIMYQDILTPLEPMGAVFHFTPGPVLEVPLRREDEVSNLKPIDAPAQLAFVGQTIQELLRQLDGDLPLLGFAGAPFTLAAFMIEGSSPGKGMPNTLAFAREQPLAFQTLMDKLTEMTIAYLNYQGEAGVHAVQLFESMGDQIPRDVYERHVQPSHQRIFSELRPGLPGILFVRESPFVDLMMDSGASVLSLGADGDMAGVLSAGKGKGPGGTDLVVQGNVDNQIMLNGTPDQVEAAVKSCINAGGGVGHILNLSHGLLPATPFENLQRFLETALATPVPQGD